MLQAEGHDNVPDLAPITRVKDQLEALERKLHKWVNVFSSARVTAKNTFKYLFKNFTNSYFDNSRVQSILAELEKNMSELDRFTRLRREDWRRVLSQINDLESLHKSILHKVHPTEKKDVQPKSKTCLVM